MDIEKILHGIAGRKTTGRDIPDDLQNFSCFVPDAGYCILCVPEIFAAEGESEPDQYCVPLPEKYVISTGYKFLKNGTPCVTVEYSSVFGAVVDEKYDTWR